MNKRASSQRWALWIFAAALLLKSAMPWLASEAARAQHKDMVEICTVYGMSMVPLDGAPHQPASDHQNDHEGAHCSLSGLAAFALNEPLPPVPTSVLFRSAPAPVAQPSSQAPDACATWVARLKHGPPLFA